MARELAARLPGLTASLQATGAGAAHPLSAQELCETIRVAYDPAVVQPAGLVAAVQGVGYDVPTATATLGLDVGDMGMPQEQDDGDDSSAPPPQKRPNMKGLLKGLLGG